MSFEKRNPSESNNVYAYSSQVSTSQRLRTFWSENQSGLTVWLTGLSGAGKSTLSSALERRLIGDERINAVCLDGDNLRHALCSDLGFSLADRSENIRRAGETAKLFAKSGVVCLSTFISPLRKDRNLVRKLHQDDDIKFVEVFVKASIEICAQRDVKGLYKRAREGLLKDFTGVQSVYEEPEEPELVVDTSELSVDECVDSIVRYLNENNLLKTSLESEKERELFVKSQDLADLQAKAERLAKLEINQVEAQWLQVLSEGWAWPLRGFMNESEYLQCLHFNTITVDGKVYNQSVPIVLSCSSEDKARLEAASGDVCLTFQGACLAVLEGATFFEHRKEERCARQFGVNDTKHPYQAFIFEECGDWLVGGRLRVFGRIKWNDGLDRYRLSPKELQARFRELQADAVFAFQLRNPIHNGHALLMKDTREKLVKMGYKNPVLLLHPLGGWTKDDDVPLRVRIEQHKACLEDAASGLLDDKTTVMAIFPSPMMYAGPTEVMWHAKARMNAGANFYIVGRDPAGLPHPSKPGSDLYEPSHGGKLLQMAPGLRGLQIVPFKMAAYDRRLGRMDYFDATRREDFDFISGTRMRKLAREGQRPPDGFMIYSAWQILADFYNPKQQL